MSRLSTFILIVVCCCSGFSQSAGSNLHALPLSAHRSTPVFNDTTTLGRFLFYDKKISINDSIACASCHHQDKAFTDGRQFSEGFEGGLTSRNSMSAVNTGFHHAGFFWDLRATTLEEQVLLPIQDTLEMGMPLDSLESKLAALPYYPPLFEAAYGSRQIDREKIAIALAGFLRSIISNRSKFDEGIPVEFANFTPQEERGRRLFSTFAVPNSGNRGANCFLCHSLTTLAPAENRSPLFASNGLDEFPSDSGYGLVSGFEEHVGTFKIPTLRNIELTGPYMHDGRFTTLEAVIEHYDSGLQNHINLDPILRDGGNITPMRLDLTPAEKADIVAFLKTFTDSALTVDPRFSNPFDSLVAISPQLSPPKAASFSLLQNYPNPFNPKTVIRYSLFGNQSITLVIYDIAGRRVRTLVSKVQGPGNYRIPWGGRDESGGELASGIYLLKLESGGQAALKKLVLIR